MSKVEATSAMHCISTMEVRDKGQKGSNLKENHRSGGQFSYFFLLEGFCPLPYHIWSGTRITSSFLPVGIL